MTSQDTTPEARRRQRDAVRRLSPSERVRAAADMSEAVRDLAAAGIRHRHPRLPETEVQAALARMLLGQDARIADVPSSGRRSNSGKS